MYFSCLCWCWDLTGRRESSPLRWNLWDLLQNHRIVSVGKDFWDHLQCPTELVGKRSCHFISSNLSDSTEEKSVEIKTFKSDFSCNSVLLKTSRHVSTSLCLYESYSWGIQDHICIFLWQHTEVSILDQAPPGLGAAQREPEPKATIIQVSGSHTDLSYI